MEKICITCRKSFETYQKRQIFCSISCGQKSRYSKSTVNCKYCQTTFETCHGRCARIFCSTQCFHAWNTGNKVCLTCENCGLEYFKVPSAAKHRRSCSKKCKYEMSARENSIRFMGVERIPIENRSPIKVYREIHLSKFGKLCYICKTQSKLIEVHHIDNDRNNNDSKNLISLCRSSHKRLHLLAKKYKISPQASLKIIKVVGCLPKNSYLNRPLMVQIDQLAKQAYFESLLPE